MINDNQNLKPKINCAQCGVFYIPSETLTKICPTCICKNYDISEGITRQGIINWCKYCKKYLGDKWVYCEVESKELLAICLKKIRGLNGVTLFNANFIWTESHSKRIKVKLTIQKEVYNDIKLEQELEIEFVVHYSQCDECKKDFTPHTWMALVQVRQKVKHKKTFLFIEQLMLKHNIHENCIKIEKVINGMNFYFKNKSHSNKMIEFLQSIVPYKLKDSKELITHDEQNGVYLYKYTTLFEIPKICKDDVIIMPSKLCKEFGGVNALALCYKISKRMHFIDPCTLRIFEMNTAQYFNYENEFIIVPFKDYKTEFIITSVEKDSNYASKLHHSFSGIETKFAEIEAKRDDDFDGSTYFGKTHLGHILDFGNVALGYDLNLLQENLQLNNIKHQKNKFHDMLIIRKHYPEYNKKKKIWKLKRMKVENAEFEENNNKKNNKKINKNSNVHNENEDLEEFMEELEQNKNLRKKVTLYKNEENIKKADEILEEFKEDKEMVRLNELMEELDIEKNEETEDKNFDNMVKNLQDIDL